MKLYVEINGEKHYINESVVKKNALHEGMITPFTGLKIKKEGNGKAVTTKPNETITALPTAIDDSEINTDINEIADSEDSTEVNESVTKKKIPRKSKLDPYLPLMKELLEKYPDITDVRVFEELCEAGFDGGKTIVTDRLRQIRRRETAYPG